MATPAPTLPLPGACPECHGAWSYVDDAVAECERNHTHRRADLIAYHEPATRAPLWALGSDAPATSEFVSAPIGSARAETNSSAHRLVFVPLPELLASAPAEPDWLWMGFLAPGCITLFAGAPKSGKSTVAFALCAALGTGGTFLGQPVSRSRVTWLVEEGPATMADKASRWGELGHVDCLCFSQAFDNAWTDVVHQAVSHARRTACGLIIADTFAQWSGLSGDSENNAGAVLGALRPLQEAAAAGLAVLLVAHGRKAPGDHGTAVRGSSALVGGVDIVVELQRPPSSAFGGQDSHRTLRSTSRFSGTPTDLAFELTPAGFVAHGTTAAAETLAERRTILDTLAQAAMTSDQLADDLKLPGATVRKLLAELLDEGAVARSGLGRRGDPYTWSLPADAPDPTDHFVSAPPFSLGAETNRDSPRAHEG